MISTFPTVLLFAAAIWTSYALGILWSSISRFSYDGDYRNAISDRCFGPISDNAGGIAEMSELPKKYVHVLISWILGIRLQQLERFSIFSSLNFIGVICSLCYFYGN
jgi:hypothetical protein